MESRHIDLSVLLAALYLLVVAAEKYTMQSVPLEEPLLEATLVNRMFV